MVNKIQFKRGLAANRTGITPSEGEPLYDTDTKKTYVGDGSTAGGNLISGGANVTAATLVVATTDSLDPSRGDYTDINTAIAALPAAGGSVFVLDGTHTNAAVINAASQMVLTGTGYASNIKFTHADATLSLPLSTSVLNTELNNLRVNGDSIASKGITIGDGATAAAGTKLNSVYVNGCTYGIYMNFGLISTFSGLRLAYNNYDIYMNSTNGKACNNNSIYGSALRYASHAALCALSSDAHWGGLGIYDCNIEGSNGWGVYIRSAHKRIANTFTNCWFESNGLGGAVTVDGTSRDPGHLFIEKSILNCTGCNFYGKFIQLVNADISLKQGYIGGNSQNVIIADSDSTIILDDMRFMSCMLHTDATVFWGNHNLIAAGANNHSMRFTIPFNLSEIAYPINLLTDPSFETSTGGVTTGWYDAPTISASTDDAVIGDKSLKVVYTAAAGSFDHNSVRFMLHKSIPTGNYVLATFFVKATANTTLSWYITGDAGLGQGTFTVGVGWSRIAIMAKNWHATAKNTYIDIAASTAATCYFDAVMSTYCPTGFDEVLRGGVENILLNKGILGGGWY